MDILATNSDAREVKEDSPKAKDWRKWLERIEGRVEQFESGWWKKAAHAERMYNSPSTDREDDLPFNILYANTEVLQPSLYSATPRPDVAMRNKSTPSATAKATEAYLRTFLDTNKQGIESFDESMDAATLGSLVSAGSFVRLRVRKGEACPVRTEHGTYKEIVWGKAKRWARVPWVAFIHTMTKDEIVDQFKLNEEQAKQVQIETQEEADTSKSSKDPNPPCRVYELWIKKTKQVVWLTAEYKDLILDDPVEDELGIEGFYPTPGPLILVRKPGTLDPTPIYEYYRNQAEELNRVTVRLNKVLDAIRVRGVYNNQFGKELERLLDSSEKENGLIPTQNAMDLQGKGFEGHIWFLPIEQLIQVAKELYSARAQIMQVIQQITGLSDIVRGSTTASETATAQDLKNRWGTIRLRRMQGVVQNYVRSLLRMAVDLAAQVMGEEEWKAHTQLPYPLGAEKQQAQMQLQAAMVEAQTAMMFAQETGQPAQPPQPPDPKLVELVKQPSWEEILASLRDDAGRAYMIDIETDSTIDRDATADREETNEFLVAMGAFIQAAAPLVQMGPSGLQVVKEMLLAICGKFKLGRQLQETIEKLQPPDPKEDPEAKREAAKMDAEMSMKREEHQQKMQLEQQKHALEMEKLQMQKQEMQLQHQIKMAELNAEMQALPAKLAMQQQQHQMSMELATTTHRQKMEAARQPPKKPANSRPT